MRDDSVVEVGIREAGGKNEARRLRHRGAVPGVVYGGGRDPVSVEFDPRPVEAILGSERGVNTLIQLRVGGRDLKRMVMLRDVQRHPVTENLMHADFFRVEMDQLVDVAVPIELTGVAIGVKDEGGILNHLSREVTVRVIASKIPEQVEVDVAELHVGQHIEASDLTFPEGVELLSPPTDTIVTVVSLAEEEVAAGAEEGEPDEAAAAESAEADSGGDE